MKIFTKERRENKKLKKANWKKQKKELKQKHKAELKAQREAIREDYADAPVLTRFFHVNARRIRKCIHVTIVLSICAIIMVLPVSVIINSVEESHIEKVNKSEPNLEEVYALSPLDEEGAARISQIPGNDPDDTWTFCVYFVGANLEDLGENDLSPYVQSLIAQEVSEISENSQTLRDERLGRYISEINESGLDVPEYLYKIQKPIASSTTVTEEVVVTDEPGSASEDIAELCENILPENITIVVQTGGATRWSNALINPNKTQRFVIKNGIMSEVSNIHLQDSCNPDTMADFITFCDENYKSDHMAMILWDHGGGITGFGLDSIFGSGMTLDDLNTAFSKALTKNINNPYFEFIGFDACLMATTDTAVALDGYGKYLVASEELMPGHGWDYGVWLKALTENPTMSGAAVGQAIADSYMNFYMKQNSDWLFAKLGGDSVVTFSVADMHKAAQVDAAYEAMNEKLLKLVIDNPTVLVDMARAAQKTMRYGEANYKYYNTIDLGTYLDYLSEQYPDECEEVRNLLREAVLYKRSYSSLEGSQGLSIYFPVEMDEFYCLYLFTEYVYSVSDKKSTNALYYYKVAGCLNDELNEYVTNLTGKSINVLDTEMFRDYQFITPEINNNDQIMIHVGKELEDNIQSVYIEIGRYDESGNTITYYGTDDCYDYDGEGNIVVDADETWFALDGSLLDARFSFDTDTTSTYIATVLHNEIPSYMTFTMNNETGNISINSMVKIPDVDDYDYASTLKTNTELLPGDTIVPIIYKQEADGKDVYETHGKKVKYKGTSKIELINLPDGDYLQTVVITDMRGDAYYSPVVGSHIKKGKITELKLEPEFTGANN